MPTKSTILKKGDNFTDKSSFAFRIFKILKTGDFDRVQSSAELTMLLNEQGGKKIKVTSLTALMDPLVKEEIIRFTLFKNRRFWYPAWLNREKALEFVKQRAGGEDGNNQEVLFFTGRQAWTDANKKFPEVISLLKGNLCIVDPYFGNGTFFVLEKFGKKRNVRFLSARLGNEEQKDITKFNNNLKRFKKEFKNIEMRKYPNEYELHDRYIISDNALVIIGYGIKDLANRESFLIYLPKELVVDFLSTLKKIFESRWKKSGNIK